MANFIKHSGGNLIEEDISTDSISDISSAAPAAGDVFRFVGSFPSATTALSPLSYWEFDEASGTTATDQGSTNNNGTYVGSPTLGVEGPFGPSGPTAVSLNGTSQRIDLSIENSYVGDTMTFGIWAKADSDTMPGTASFIGQDDNTGDRWTIFVSSTGTLQFYVTNTVVATYVISDDPLPDLSGWHHYVVTFDSGTVAMYRDGVALALNVVGTNLNTIPTSTDLLMIGSRDNSDNWWPGDLAQVVFLDQVLSPTAVTNWYASAANPVYANVPAPWVEKGGVNGEVAVSDDTDPEGYVWQKVGYDNFDDETADTFDLIRENGFINRTDSTLSFDDGTRTFTITPVGADFEFVSGGTSYLVSAADSVVIPDSEGLHFFYYDVTGTLVSTQVFNNEIILTYAFVALAYWDATNNTAITLAEERHGSSMNSQTHLYNHETIGTRYGEGLQVADVDADGSGNDATAAQISVGAGIIWDEDIEISIPGDTAPASIPILYREGVAGGWRKVAATDYIATVINVGERAAYNQNTGATWQLTESPNNDFLLMHLFATNDINDGYFLITGQESYTSLSNARDGAPSEIFSLETDGLPVVEYKAVATFILETRNSYSNAVKARVRTTSDDLDFLDWRFLDSGLAINVGSATTSDHGALAGLLDDDHTQYLLADGSRDLTGTWDIGTNFILGGGGASFLGFNDTGTSDISAAGDLRIRSGVGTGDGGTIDILADSNNAQSGGTINVTAGTSVQSTGGILNLTGGKSGGTNVGGHVNITAGDGGNTSGDGGDINLTTGSNVGAGSQGDLTIDANNLFLGNTSSFTDISGSMVLGGGSSSKLNVDAGLTISSGDTTAGVATSGSDELVIEGSGAAAGMTIISTAINSGYYSWGNPTDTGIGWVGYEHNDNDMVFGVNGAQVAQFNTDGVFMVGTTDVSVQANTSGEGVNLSHELLAIARDANVPVLINRMTNDGALINFFQGGTKEGDITVSGNTVSLTGGHLSRWSQLEGNKKRKAIPRGTVMSTVDEMCEWAYVEEDIVVKGGKDPKGNTKPDKIHKKKRPVKTNHPSAVLKPNPQLTRSKISDVVADKTVAGIFQNWVEDDEDGRRDDMELAEVGDYIIRVTGPVAKGDLLESNGDGTARAQADDLVRSSTIAKALFSFDTAGEHIVPCLLMLG